MMKKMIINCCTTTGLSLLLLAVVASAYDARFICVETVFQAELANVVIHVGLMLCGRLESKYFFAEIAVEVTYMLIVLAVFGCLFNWYTSTPLWLLCFMGICIYVIGSLTGIFRVKSDVDIINQELNNMLIKQKEK